MKYEGLLECLLDRLGHADGHAVYVTTSELNAWSSSEFKALRKAQLLSRATPPPTITCTGCEEHCAMPVHIYATDKGKPAIAFIACDKRDDMGRVPVDIAQLKRWRMTHEGLAKVVTICLGIQKPPREAQNGRWLLGMLRGGSSVQRVQVTLATQNGLYLQVAGHSVLLADLLTVNHDKIGLDVQTLHDMVDAPLQRDDPRHEYAKLRREARKLATREKYANWKNALKVWRRKKPGMSKYWYAQQIAKSDVGQGAAVDTIRKNMG